MLNDVHENACPTSFICSIISLSKQLSSNFSVAVASSKNRDPHPLHNSVMLTCSGLRHSTSYNYIGKHYRQDPWRVL